MQQETGCILRKYVLFVKDMEQEYEKVEKTVSKEIEKRFNKERVHCLLRYGPSKTKTGKSPHDLDFLLLLDTFNSTDYLEICEIKKLNLSIEIFIDYENHIALRGIENYKRGCHGSYFVHILASAKTLLGDNFFSNKTSSITAEKVRADLLNRIEEYFYRVQKIILNDTSETISPVILKYTARIITDLLLLNNEIDFTDMHTYHYTDIVQSKLGDSSLFYTDEVVQIQNLFSIPSPSISQILPVISILNRIFEQLIRISHD